VPWRVWELGEQGYIFPEQGDAILMKNTTRFPWIKPSINKAQSIDGLCGFGFVQQALP